LLYPAVVAMIFLALGLVAFRRLSGEIVDEL
jgi:ABC-type polysaccharide/polyol phosphate export permease